MASTISPTRTEADRPNDAGRSDPAPAWTLITARSSGANTPTTVAASGLPPLASPTCSVVALPTTWALVTMSPLGSYTTPDPDPWLVEICTTEGRTRLTTCSYCCSSEDAAPDEGIADDGAAEEVPAEGWAADVAGPPEPALQAAAPRAAMVIPAAPSRRPTAGFHGWACADARSFFHLGTWPPVTSALIPGLPSTGAIAT